MFRRKHHPLLRSACLVGIFIVLGTVYFSQLGEASALNLGGGSFVLSPGDHVTGGLSGDADLNFVFVNKACASMFGVAPQQMLGRKGDGSKPADDGKSPYNFGGIDWHFDPYFEPNTIVGIDTDRGGYRSYRVDRIGSVFVGSREVH